MQRTKGERVQSWLENKVESRIEGGEDGEVLVGSGRKKSDTVYSRYSLITREFTEQLAVETIHHHLIFQNKIKHLTPACLVIRSLTPEDYHLVRA